MKIIKFFLLVLLVRFLIIPCYSQPEFDWHTVDTTLAYPVLPIAVDINNDGHLDIVCAAEGEPIMWWKNEGFPVTFTRQDTLLDNFESGRSVAAADLNDDGDIDIVATGYVGFDSYIKWWENNGEANPTFTGHTFDDNDEVKDPVTIGDLDNDDDNDIITWGVFRDGPEVTKEIMIYENVDNEIFMLTRIELESYFGPQDLSVYDFDQDQDLDIIFSNSHNYWWMENIGNLEFEADESLNIDGEQGSSFDIADIDNDSDPDIVGTPGMSDDEIIWLENEGLNPPNFIEHYVVEWYTDPVVVQAGDIDNDDDIDVIAAAGDPINGNWGEITLWINDGEQIFEEYVLEDFFLGPFGENCLSVVDLDFDGDQDILGTAMMYPVLAWFENRLIDAEIEPFHLESPEPGFTTPDTLVVLVWNRAIPNFETDITYHIKCHNNPDNDEIIAETTDTTYVFTGIPGTQYFWDVKAVADNGLEQWSEEQYWHFTIVDTTNAVNDPFASSIPTEFAIQSVYPNPFNASTTITVALPQPSNLSLQIFNTTGQQVSTIAEGQFSQGYHDFVFNGSGLSSGIYFVQFVIPRTYQEMQKVLLIK